MSNRCARARAAPPMPTFDQWDILVRVSAVVAAAVGLALPGGWRRRAAPVTQRPWMAALAVVALNVMVNAGVALQHGIPRPRVHDEFSYLLAADTFAHGRLANPTPACADSFQSPHVLVRPTYASKYPPGQGLALAAGQLLGRPVYGVWISCALAAVGVWWMLLAFVPAEWALLGGLVAAIHPTLVDWGHVYWGGAVAMAGGAIAIGAWGRLMGIAPAACGFADQRLPSREAASGKATPRPGALLGVGLIVLANSRPYEGLILSLPLLASLVWQRCWRAVPGLVAVVLLGAVATGYYDYRVTGRALRLPFAEYAAQFDVYPKFWFLPKRSPPPSYPNATMAEVHVEKERGRYDLLRTPAGRVATAITWAQRLSHLHARPAVLLVPLAASVLVVARDRRARWVAVTVAVFLTGLMAENWFLPHYAAPVFPAGLLMIVLGWRQLGEWPGKGAAIAARLARGVAVGFFAAAALSAAAPADPELARFTRDDLMAEIPALSAGQHVVFILYAADHPVEDEWVYNGADLAGQPILWARSLGPARDAAVLAAYGPRRAWVLTVGKSTHTMAAWKR